MLFLLCCVQAAEAQRQQHVEQAAQSAAKRARKIAAAKQAQPAQEFEQPAPADVQHAATAAAAAAEPAAMAPGGEDRLPDEVVAELLQRQRCNPFSQSDLLASCWQTPPPDADQLLQYSRGKCVRGSMYTA
jgi:hypothetical protein